MKRSIFFILIIIFALSLRIYNLYKVPPSLFGDEVDVGYQAYSLLQTGKDLSGNSWPILIQSLSEYRAPLFIYSSIPFVGIFGLNEWGVRLTSVFWAMIGIVGLFLLTRKMFNEKVALLAVLVLTVSPWHIHYSRAGFEVSMLLVVILFAVYFFILSLEKKRYLFISAILFGLTPYIYSTAVLFMPLLLLILAIIYRKRLNINFKFSVISLAILFVALTPYALQTFSGKSGERFSVVSIFTEKAFNDKYDILRRSGQENLNIFEKIFHNKPTIWAQIFTLNYLRAFSPEFLFLTGDPNFRHSIHEMGQMYYFEIILLLLGISLLINEKSKSTYLIFGWLLVAPIPAALTFDGGFHATRNFLMLFPLSVLVALGILFILEKAKNNKLRILSASLILLAIINFTFFVHRYFIHYPVESWATWHDGFKGGMVYIAKNQKNYDRVLINNTYEPSLIRFLFWTKYDPAKFQQGYIKDVEVKNITEGFDGFSLENKYFFGKVNKPIEEFLTDKDLYLASARDDITNPNILYDQRLSLLKIIYSPNNVPIFYLITGSKE